MSSDRCYCAWEGAKEGATMLGGLIPRRPGEVSVDSGSPRGGSGEVDLVGGGGDLGGE